MVKARFEKEGGGSALISVDEMKEREKKYLQRLQDISICYNLVKESTSEFERLEEERAALDRWEHFKRCDGLPRPDVPPEMREFLAKKRFYQQFFTDHSVDWTLSVDERSILTQNIFRHERTRQQVKENLDDHIGEKYELDINMFLTTLNKIEYMLDTAVEMDNVNFERHMEIMEVRREIEHEIDESFDRLTYRIIRMDGVYMNSTDAMIATWSHGCPQFSIDIWALRDVPIRFREMATPFMIAEMLSTKTTVQIPLSVLHDCLTFRVIHTNFDTYSQYAKSYDPIIPESNIDVNAGILDMQECLINEWLMQVDIQKELLANLLEKREIYEETMRMIAEKIDRAAKEAKNSDGKEVKIVIPKPPKEALLVPPGMLPDSYSTFLEREQQQYLDLLEEIYGPEHLKLSPDEVNLRQHIFLGGLYSLMFVRRPSDTHFQTFNITLHEDGRVLHIKKDIVADLHYNAYDSRLDSRMSINRSRLKIEQAQQKRKTTMIEDDELPYFFVTFQVEPELCLWGEPQPCHYMDTMEDEPSEIFTPPDVKESAFKKKKSKMGSRHHDNALLHDDNNFNQIHRRETTTVNTFRPTLICLLRTSRKLQPGERRLPVSNFELMQQLDHLKMRQLQRYCVPRILSSFKFPLEVKEELEQMFDQRPKTRNMLIRRRSIEAEETFVVGDLDFDYEVQQAPERVYPVFEDVERITYAEEDIEHDIFDKKTMYGLIDTFDSISDRYIARHRDIMNQPDFGYKKPPAKKAAYAEARIGSVVSKFKSLMRATGSRQSSLRASHSPISISTAVGNIATSHLNLREPDADDVRSEDEDVEPIQGEEIVKERPKKRVVRWTTQHILSSHFDRAARTITIKTDRLGIIGFAFKRYEHFPFRDWSLQPSEENNEEIMLSVDTFHARVILYISAQGVRGYVTDISKTYVAHPVKYMEIKTPTSDYRELRRRFYDKCVNIFAEHDACYYIDNGYFSVKHMATENHTYDAMALHCKLMKFYRSSWNRLASRRNILIGMKGAKDVGEFTEVTVRITPDNATFVEVSELCSDDLDIIKLDFKNTWRNMSNYTDLHQAICSMNPHATDVRNKDPLLLFQVKRMLNEIHVLSFS